MNTANNLSTGGVLADAETASEGGRLLHKEAVRDSMRRRRDALEPARAAAHSTAICRHLLTFPALLRANSSALYLPINNEVNLTPLIRPLHGLGLRLYLPVTCTHPPGLRFVPFSPDDTLAAGPYGIPEPVQREGALAGPELAALQVMLLPLLAFDAKGRRLGYGGGYYDRALAWLAARRGPGRAGGDGPLLVGVGYRFQQVESLPASDHDVPLQYAVTEEGIMEMR